ncbi:GAF domain-containing protein [Pseudarthrobacter sp. So.54]
MSMHSMGERPDYTAIEQQPMIDGVIKGFVSRAEELLQSQERMAGLLEAVVAVAEDLSLDAVLERVVQSGCRLLRARYGALGVIGDDKALSHFISVGIDEQLAHRIGPLPTGHGVLGLLISDPRPLRLHDLRNHPEAYGFPGKHPPMKSFLGVPVRVRDVVFGNLYLTEKEDGSDFTDEDEGLAVALAAAAGVAIENARLYDDARRRARWLEACMDVSGLMLGTDRDYTMRRAGSHREPGTSGVGLPARTDCGARHRWPRPRGCRSGRSERLAVFRPSAGAGFAAAGKCPRRR